MTELVTDRLHLRQFRPGDFEEHAAICADPEVMRFIRAGALSRSDSWWQLARSTTAHRPYPRSCQWPM